MAVGVPTFPPTGQALLDVDAAAGGMLVLGLVFIFFGRPVRPAGPVRPGARPAPPAPAPKERGGGQRCCQVLHLESGAWGEDVVVEVVEGAGLKLPSHTSRTAPLVRSPGFCTRFPCPAKR